MFEDFKELLSAFNGRNVRYLVVGGYAVGVHAQPRATKDLDLLIRTDSGNAAAVYSALAQFGAPLEGVSAEDFTDPNTFFRMGNPPLRIEILPRIDGVDFDAAWARREEILIDPEGGLKAPFLSRDDLITTKLASGRPQDLADVEAIRNAQRSNAKNGV
jgi:uncharacterized nucleotidyltransferase DUF6036